MRTRKSLEEELAQRHRNLNKLKEKIAKWTDLEAPVHLQTQLEDEEKAIAELERMLREGEYTEEKAEPAKRKKPSRKKKIWGQVGKILGGIVLLITVVAAVFQILGVGLLQIFGWPPLPGPTPTSTATPLAFPTATSEERLVIVADFEDKSDGTYTGVDPAMHIYQILRKDLPRRHPQARVERLRQVVRESDARAIGEAYNATLLVWGSYDSIGVTPWIEIIKKPEWGPLTTEQAMDISTPDRARICMLVDLPAHSKYLTNFALGLLYLCLECGKEDLRRAADFFTAAIEAIPPGGECYVEMAEAYFGRGLTYGILGDYERAIADYDKAIELDPKDAAAYYNRGLAYADKGEYERAIADYDKAIELDPKDANPYYGRGLIYKGQGEKEKAIADFEKFLELATDPYWRGKAEEILRDLRGE